MVMGQRYQVCTYRVAVEICRNRTCKQSSQSYLISSMKLSVSLVATCISILSLMLIVAVRMKMKK